MTKNTLWYLEKPKDIAENLGSDLKLGHTSASISKLKEFYGSNTFTKGKEDTVLDLFIRQIKNPLVLTLAVASIATLLLKEYGDSIVIAVAVLINVSIGIFQERKAGKSFKALERSQNKFATVIRDGVKDNIQAEDLVPGDIIVVQPGEYIPADSRLIEVNDLLINEASLTGEWKSVEKHCVTYEEEIHLTDQKNMLFMGTVAVAGSGIAIVTATGKTTEMGKIALSLGYVTEDTPFQKSIRSLAKFLMYVITIIISVILALGLIRGESLSDLLLVSIALAVSAIPEGLPIAVTVVLAFGMTAILKKGGLVRNLLAAETLGSTTYILTDKTGTLTRAEMRIREVLNLEQSEKDLKETLAMAVLSSDAYTEHDGVESVVQGRPVEKAVILGGMDRGLIQSDLRSIRPQLDTLTFDSKRRLSASLHKTLKGDNDIYFVGAPEVILNNSTKILKSGRTVKITDGHKKKLHILHKDRTDQGMRLVGVGFMKTKLDVLPNDEEKIEELIKDEMIFAGYLVMHDPIREDVVGAIKTAEEAGTTVVMITGDHAGTALSVAKSVGIKTENDTVHTGDEVEKMSDEELVEALMKVRVYARMLPKQKLRISTLLKTQGEVVAMTGDGVNDAPALRNANIGIAVGSGTEVAKEASDLILIDNSFSVIVKAIEEGRRILDNLKKIVSYLLATGFSEIALVFGALLIGNPLPILPVQILWANIVGEGFMNFAFAFEPSEDDVMKRNPKSESMRTILTRKVKRLIFIMSGVTSLIVLTVYFWLQANDFSIEYIRTIMFAAISIDSIFFAFSLKNMHKPIWKINPFSNKYLLGSLVISVGMLLVALFFDPIRNLLSLEVLSGGALLAVLLLGITNLFFIELVKYILFLRSRDKVLA